MLKFDFKASLSSVPLSDSIVDAMNSDNSKVLGVETNFVTSSDCELMVMINSDGKYGNIPARNLAFIEMLSDDDSLAIENKLELTYQLEKDAYHLEKEKEKKAFKNNNDMDSGALCSAAAEYEMAIDSLMKVSNILRGNK